MMRTDLLKNITLTTPGALINTEMLARSRRGGATIVEVGVHHYPRLAGESSGGSPRVVLRAMGETVRLWMRLRREGKATASGSDAVSTKTTDASGSRVRSFAPLAALGAVAGALFFWRKRRQ